MSGPMPQNTIRLPVNAQRWSALTFLHWPVAPALIQERLPRGLHVQTYEGAAWIGLTPFLMQDLRVPPLPALPGWSTFPEVNLRTYVRHEDGTDGLWFLGLWSTRRAMNAAMRTIGLPYHRTEATIQPVGGGGMTYDARPARHAVPLRLRVAVRAGAPISAPTELEGKLTGRWNAYTVRGGHVWRVPVTHQPWPLRRASLDHFDTDVFEVMGLPTPQVEPLVLVSPGVDTLIGVPRPAGPPTSRTRPGEAA
ncbi:YqjF family protein [Oerskovia sp. NPDC060338]|uniref:YqjF family protein n=1 Tax=Oerskovia sp. NPDC060338 TaxID=3347100 RepID=UPI003658DB4B